MTTLYELTDSLLYLQDLMESGEYDEETLADTMESIELVFEDKADGYAKIMRNFESSVEAIKAEKKRLDDRQKVYENSIKRLKENLRYSMETTGKRKFKTDLFSFSIQKNPSKVVIDNEGFIPPDCWIEQAPKIDKKKLKEELENGDKLAMQCAHLEQGESLRIR